MTALTSVTFSGQTFTYESLFNLTGSELVKIHNQAAPKAGVEPTKRFGDKLAGVKRTWGLLAKLSEGATVASAPSEVAKKADEPKVTKEMTEGLTTPPGGKGKVAKAPKIAKEKKEAAPRKPRGMRFVFPQGDELKKVREGTMRAKLVQLLTRTRDGTLVGATFEQCLAQTWGTKEDMDVETQTKTCYEAMRLLHYYVGYGMKHLDDSDKPHIAIFFKAK